MDKHNFLLKTKSYMAFHLHLSVYCARTLVAIEQVAGKYPPLECSAIEYLSDEPPSQ